MDVIAAVKAGDVPALERALAREPELAGASEDGISAVRLALYHRQPAALEALLAAQPPLDGLDLAALGWTEDLHRALAADPELVSRRSPDGFTALHYAAFFGGAEAVELLLAAGADPHAVTDNDAHLRPLHSAAAARDAAAAQHLLDAGADPDAAAGRRVHGAARRRAARRRGARGAACCATAPIPTVRTDDGADAAALARAVARHGGRARCSACLSRRSGPCRSSARGPARARRSRAA